MRYARASALVPFLRSDLVGAIMAEVLLQPERARTVSEIAAATGGSYSGVHREIERLSASGIFSTTAQGRNRLVMANTAHPLYQPARDLFLATFGPVPVLRELLGAFDNVEGAAIYGSWAARRAGEPGLEPCDIDLLIIGNLPRRSAAKLAGEATKILGVEVHCLVLTSEEWANGNNAFVRTIQNRPLIWLTDEITARPEPVA